MSDVVVDGSVQVIEVAADEYTVAVTDTQVTVTVAPGAVLPTNLVYLDQDNAGTLQVTTPDGTDGNPPTPGGTITLTTGNGGDHTGDGNGGDGGDVIVRLGSGGDGQEGPGNVGRLVIQDADGIDRLYIYATGDIYSVAANGYLDITNGSNNFFGTQTLQNASPLASALVVNQGFGNATVPTFKIIRGSLQFGVDKDGHILSNQTTTSTDTHTAGRIPFYNSSGTIVGYAPLYASDPFASKVVYKDNQNQFSVIQSFAPTTDQTNIRLIRSTGQTSDYFNCIDENGNVVAKVAKDGILTLTDAATSRTCTIKPELNGVGTWITSNVGIVLDGNGSRIQAYGNDNISIAPSNGIPNLVVRGTSMATGVPILFSSTAYVGIGTTDVGLNRDSAGVLKVNDGSTGSGSLKVGDVTGTGIISNAFAMPVGSGDTYRIYHTDTTYNRKVGFFFGFDGAEGGVKADSTLFLKAGAGGIYLAPSGSSFGVQFSASGDDIHMECATGSLVNQSHGSTVVPDVVRGAISQTPDLTQWQDSSSNVLARVTKDGYVSGNRVYGSNPSGCYMWHRANATNLLTYTGPGGNDFAEFNETYGFFLAGNRGVLFGSNSGAVGSTDVGLIRPSAGVILVNAGDGSTSSTGIITGGFRPVHQADTSAANDTIYFSTDAGKLVYKTSGGVVNNLY